MDIDKIRSYCLAQKAVTEGFPFDETTLVFKVSGKMFALINLDGELRINLKCEPDLALELRASYPDTVLPGYHMSKKHWNTVRIDGQVEDTVIMEWIDRSYNLVVKGLPAKLRRELEDD